MIKQKTQKFAGSQEGHKGAKGAKLADLKPAPYNPRAITGEALGALKASLGEFGDVAGVTWNRRTGHLVTGHQRLRALLEEHGDGLKLQRGVLHTPAGETFPVRVVDWPIEREKAANIAANSPLLAGVFTEDVQDLVRELEVELPELAGDLLLGQLLESLGFVDVEGIEEDEAPEPPDNAVTEPGDLWQLGDHRLLCGDSADAAHVDRLLAGAEVHLVNTDPPYNVRVEPRSGTAIAAGLSSFSAQHHQEFDEARGKKPKARKRMRAKDRPLENDFVSDEAFDELLRAWFGNMARVLLPGHGFYIWGGYSNSLNFPLALKVSGLYFSQAIIWVKEHPVLTRKDFMGNHEWCFYGWRPGAAHRFFGPPNVPDVWSVKKVAPQRMIHLTEKPVELAARALSYSSRKGENVLDLFGGSGSTLSAAEQTGRRAFLMEIDPLYCDVIVERWQNLTGRKARRRRAKKE